MKAIIPEPPKSRSPKAMREWQDAVNRSIRTLMSNVTNSYGDLSSTQEDTGLAWVSGQPQWLSGYSGASGSSGSSGVSGKSGYSGFSGYSGTVGSYNAGAPSATGYVTVVIGGITYKLLAST